jgi:membrane protein DedA with SNARE-associated domain
MGELLQFLVRHGYAVVFVWVLGEQIGLPIPAVPILLAAGALAGSGRLSLSMALLVAVAASLVSDTIWYWLGRRRGTRVLSLLCRISLEPDSCVRRTEDTFVRHGPRTLLVAKFVPGLSTMAPPLAGIIGMPLWRFVVWDGLGALLWAGVFAGLGYAGADQLERVAAHVGRFGSGAVAIVAALFAAYIAWKWVERRRFIRRLRIARIAPEELKRRLDAGEATVIVDLRGALDFASDPTTIPGALVLTPEELEARHQEIPRDREIVLYCT